MTFKYDNVYLNETSVVAGKYESNGRFRKYFDKIYKDFYFGEKTFEDAEVKSIKDSIRILLNKSNLKKKDIDIVFNTDLSNQITNSYFGTIGVGNGNIGVYSACSGSVLSMIILSNFINSGMVNRGVCCSSSHNLTSERQFRYPIEYGSIRKDSNTFTCTGCASCLLSNKKSLVRVESATIGRVVDYKQNDVNDMGRVMAPSAYTTIMDHLKDLKRKPDYYDLIITGDLGSIGKSILIDMLNTSKYHFNNIDDSGYLIYSSDDKDIVHAGGSGPVCSPMVNYSYIFSLLKKGELKRVLIVATGALFNPISVHQGKDIYSVSHAISLEAI